MKKQLMMTTGAADKEAFNLNSGCSCEVCTCETCTCGDSCHCG